jgi:hypothetical protein
MSRVCFHIDSVGCANRSDTEKQTDSLAARVEVVETLMDTFLIDGAEYTDIRPTGYIVSAVRGYGPKCE